MKQHFAGQGTVAFISNGIDEGKFFGGQANLQG
jgi:hypothetical protein